MNMEMKMVEINGDEDKDEADGDSEKRGEIGAQGLYIYTAYGLHTQKME